MQRVPQELPPDESEEVVERVAAIDVAKKFGTVCTRVPHPRTPGRRLSKVWDVDATTGSLMALADQLLAERIERVTLESTSDYWRPFYYVLEARGLDVWLVNARDAKNVPGRAKTDRIDAAWMAKLTERGMLRRSFVPPAEIRHLRDYTRLRADLTAERSRYAQRLEKLLEDALIKLSSVATDILGLSSRSMLDALIAGERDPQVLAELARGRMRVKRPALIEALNGQFDDHHAELARLLLDQIDALNGQIDRLTTRTEQLIAAIPAAAPTGGDDPGNHSDGGPSADARPLSVVERLDEVTGIGIATAQVVIAEIGLDMARFPTAAHLASWAKWAPRTVESGGKRRRGRTGQGNPYLKAALFEAATVAARTNTFLGARYRRLVKRMGKLKALVAVARSMLVIIWHLLADPTARYRDLGPDYHSAHIDRDRRARNHIRQLHALGFSVTVTPAA